MNIDAKMALYWCAYHGALASRRRERLPDRVIAAPSAERRANRRSARLGAS